MSKYIDAGNIGAAWLRAYEALMSAPGRQIVNLAVNISEPLMEDVGVRASLEGDLARLRDNPTRRGNWQSVHTVANTIFPISLYTADLSDSADRFFKHAIAADRNRRGMRSGWGTYIGRLLDYERPDGSRVNQLEKMLEVLGEDRKWSDLYEAPITYPGEIADITTPASADFHLISPSDRRRRGGPCLAHISITALDGQLHLAAQYRRHSYVARAYGNFLGLARLLNFLAIESGNQVGTMLVVGTHAEIEKEAGANRGNLLMAAQAAEGEIRSIETTNRPLGASWRDLELPMSGAGAKV
ncbi:hypothetical protein [Streptosporangium sp. H16]|uniref:hypothetical protein n=1 Tax=Streptosporangium sp. H16 TaxID=3444184 RepID=UPI003F7AFB3F